MLKSIISFAIVSIACGFSVGETLGSGFGQRHAAYDGHASLGSTLGLGSQFGQHYAHDGHASLGSTLGLGSQFGQHYAHDGHASLGSTLGLGSQFGQHYAPQYGYGRQFGYGSHFGQRHSPFDTDSQLFGQHANLGSGFGYGSQFGGFGYGGLGQFGGIGQLLSGNTNPLIRNMLVKNLLEQLMDKHITEFNAASADVTAQTIILEKFASEVMHLGLHLSL